MGMTPKIEDLKDWVPIRVYRAPEGHMLDWCYMGSVRFDRPFFDNSITSRMTNPFSKLFRHQTPIELLADLLEQAPCIKPTGFIFHMSRCGSTLVSQMLSKLPENIVISEAPPIDAVIRANIYDPGVTVEQRITWLTWLLASYGRRRTGAERGLFIKFDSWNTFDISLIEQAFPEVPWVFIYRNPVEVMVSQLKRPGVQMIRGAIDRMLPGMPLMEAIQMPAEEYCARALAAFCETALNASTSPNARLIEYTQLPGAVTNEITHHFGLAYSQEEVETMTAVIRFDAKNPSLAFSADSGLKQAAAEDAVRQAAAAWVDPLYRKLRARQAEMNG